MAKKITGYIKLQVPAGKANPAPPIGPALGQHGVNIMEFCKAFNAKTAQMDPDLKIPVVITVFADRSFTFETLGQAEPREGRYHLESEDRRDRENETSRFEYYEPRVRDQDYRGYRETNGSYGSVGGNKEGGDETPIAPRS